MSADSQNVPRFPEQHRAVSDKGLFRGNASWLPLTTGVNVLPLANCQRRAHVLASTLNIRFRKSDYTWSGG